MKIPALPKFLQTKLYKTSQTRGADDDVIYQNRVSRNSTVLIDYEFVDVCMLEEGEKFENGYIVLISPETFFNTPKIKTLLKEKNLVIGKNLLIFYQTRKEWDLYNPLKLKLKPAMKRKSPLGGAFVARVPATTAIKNGEKINLGFNSTLGKGAGIRIYEYANLDTMAGTRLQLEQIFWCCRDSEESLLKYGMKVEDVKLRRKYIEELCIKTGLFDQKKLIKSRIINSNKKSICPLCLEEISALGFFNKVLQAEGRRVSDLTVTELNLFHIKELRVGSHNHVPYNLGWGHHHCNMVVKDSGINETLTWMKKVVTNNKL